MFTPTVKAFPQTKKCSHRQKIFDEDFLNRIHQPDAPSLRALFRQQLPCLAVKHHQLKVINLVLKVFPSGVQTQDLLVLYDNEYALIINIYFYEYFL